MMTVDLPEAPAYFPRDAEINRIGAEVLSELGKPEALTPAQVREQTSQTDSLPYSGPQTNNSGFIVLDVRGAAEFGAGHLPGSINIGLGGQFAIWAGTLIPIGAPIIIVSDSEAKALEAVTRLARVGHENVKGYLAGGVAAWSAAGFEVDTVPQITVSELNEKINVETRLQVIDVRRPPEYASGHVPQAITAPLQSLRETLTNLPLDPIRPTAVICAGGYRSSAATSILEQRGFSNLFNVTGGTSAWIVAGFAVDVAKS
jgi:rhodanese-related sulfurtransferase